MAREALEVLKECEAFLEGHFLLSSGRHSGAYCQMAFLQQYPDKAAEVMAPVAEKLKEMSLIKITRSAPNMAKVARITDGWTCTPSQINST